MGRDGQRCALCANCRRRFSNHEALEEIPVDAATEWVAPSWISWPPDSPMHAAVWVLNCGTTQATVTVRFNLMDGSVFHKEVLRLPPRTTLMCRAVASERSRVYRFGWVHIRSDQPILPWGRTPADISLGDMVQMSFYRQTIALRLSEQQGREPRVRRAQRPTPRRLTR